jgi:D-alanyl-D-alanine carboxypeptidase/Putative peptidoglycan binding domain
MTNLGASVGTSGRNNRDDVTAVQQLLIAAGIDCGTVDGLCGARTCDAIRAFQRGFMSEPSGLVEPASTTFVNLQRASDRPAAPDTAPLTRPVPLPDRSTLNPGLQAVNNALMTSLFGAPRADYTEKCQPVTQPALLRHITTGNVGPFSVTGMTQAVRSLREVFTELRLVQPVVYSLLSTAGMLCCRWVRGSTESISNHSWGTAIDLKLDGELDVRGNNQVQYGLTLIAPVFNKFGWYWGAAFRTEDAMHFEASRALVESWRLP